MEELYWDAGDAPQEVLRWVSNNVAEAIRYYWEDDPPVAWIGDDIEKTGGRLVLTVAGPGKATEEDPSGQYDVYTIDVDLLDEITEWVNLYADIGGPCSNEQRDDLRERASVLREIAKSIVGLADAAEMEANSFSRLTD